MPAPRRTARAGRGQRVSPLLDDLAVDDLLVVLTDDETGVFEPRHHLVERGRRAPNPVVRQPTPQVPAHPGPGAEQRQHEKLQVGDGRDPPR